MPAEVSAGLRGAIPPFSSHHHHHHQEHRRLQVLLNHLLHDDSSTLNEVLGMSQTRAELVASDRQQQQQVHQPI